MLRGEILNWQRFYEITRPVLDINTKRIICVFSKFHFHTRTFTKAGVAFVNVVPRNPICGFFRQRILLVLEYT